MNGRKEGKWTAGILDLRSNELLNILFGSLNDRGQKLHDFVSTPLTKKHSNQ